MVPLHSLHGRVVQWLNFRSLAAICQTTFAGCCAPFLFYSSLAIHQEREREFSCSIVFDQWQRLFQPLMIPHFPVRECGIYIRIYIGLLCFIIIRSFCLCIINFAINLKFHFCFCLLCWLFNSTLSLSHDQVNICWSFLI